MLSAGSPIARAAADYLHDSRSITSGNLIMGSVHQDWNLVIYKAQTSGLLRDSGVSARSASARRKTLYLAR